MLKRNVTLRMESDKIIKAESLVNLVHLSIKGKQESGHLGNGILVEAERTCSIS